MGLGQVKEAPQQINETAKNGAFNQQKGGQNPSSTTSKPAGKQGKQDSQPSDAPKEEYIHVRARRGQATNSHSLAERVKIYISPFFKLSTNKFNIGKGTLFK